MLLFSDPELWAPEEPDRPLIDTDTVSSFVEKQSGNGHGLVLRWIEKSRVSDLEILIRALMETGVCGTSHEALFTLLEMSEGVEPDVEVSLTDVKGRFPRCDSVRKIAAKLGSPGPGKIVHHVLGEMTHGIVQNLLRGYFPRQDKGGQMRLFEGFAALLPGEQMGLPWGNPLLVVNPARFAGKALRNNFIRPDFLSELRALYKEMMQFLKMGSNPAQKMMLVNHLLPELMERLIPLVGVENVLWSLHKGEWEVYLHTLSLLSWTRVILSRMVGSRRHWPIMFCEVPIPPAGRADFVRVVSINGKPPRRGDRRTLRHMAASRRGCLDFFSRAVRYFPELVVEIDDWKDSSGDNDRFGRVLARRRVRERPLPTHSRQLKRYLAIAGSMLGSPERATGGTLFYGFPGEIRKHRVSVDPSLLQEEADEFFVKVTEVQKDSQARAVGRRVASQVLEQCFPNKSSVIFTGGH